jgi:hypothetical protein
MKLTAVIKGCRSHLRNNLYIRTQPRFFSRSYNDNKSIGTRYRWLQVYRQLIKCPWIDTQADQFSPPTHEVSHNNKCMESPTTDDGCRRIDVGLFRIENISKWKYYNIICQGSSIRCTYRLYGLITIIKVTQRKCRHSITQPAHAPN